MKGVKTIKKMPKGLKEAGLSQDAIEQMFEELIGTNRVDLYYAYPRFVTMATRLNNLFKLGEALSDRFFLEDVNNYNEFVDFQEGILGACRIIKKIPVVSNEDLLFRKYKEDVILEFTKHYNEFRNHPVLVSIMSSAETLRSISADLKDNSGTKKLSWIDRIEGTMYHPLHFCPEFNVLSLKNSNSVIIGTWRSYLRAIFETGEFFSEELQKPDIDIKKFCSTVITILTNAEREPGLQGCAQAFSKIKESMNLLEENFGRYYKEFVCADKNSSSIFVSFIKDVTDKNSNASIGIVAQFTKILNFYMEQMERQGMKLDPALSKLSKETISSLNKYASGSQKKTV